MSGVQGGGIENPGGGGTATAAAFTLNGTTESVSLVAGANITFNSGANSITILGPTVPAATNFFLNGTSSSVSLVAGAGIAFASGNSSISISASVQTVSGSLTALGNTTSSSAGTYTNLLNFSGAGIASVGVGNGSVTISVPAPVNFSTVSLTGLGNTTVSSTGSFNNLLNISGAGGVSIGMGAGSLTISGAVPVNFSTISLSASGNTTGATSSGTMNNVLAFSGMGIASVGIGNGTVSISVTTPSVTNFSTISLSASGNTTGATSSGTYNNVLAFSGMGGISIGAGNGTISISGPVAGGAAGTQSLSAGANSVTGTGVSLALFAGNNIGLATATAAGALSVTISDSLQQTTRISFTQNALLQGAGLLTSTAGTITGSAGYGSSLFLQRIWIEQQINLSEVDLAIGIAFPATNQGAGTISRSVVVYSFGNSTSLASVLSFSSTSAWTTGTVTAGGSVSLTQFQGGWAGTLIQPMTFASSTLRGGEYVIGNLINFAQGSSTWSLSLYGPNAAAQSSVSLGSGLSVSSGSVLSTDAKLTTAQFQTSGSAVGGRATYWAWTSSASAPNTVAALTSASLGTQLVSLLSVSTLPTFGFIGTGSTTSAFPYWFNQGIMSTGAVPAAITLTSTAVTYLGSIALAQPWFALAGA